jgi:hypothetical protein
MQNFTNTLSSLLSVALTLVLVLLFVSCDTIEKGNYLTPVELPETKRKVLIEDYTGMKCTNCPSAASTIDSLKKYYGDNIVAVSIHAGVYAKPSGIFVKDFRTESGTIYNSNFSIDAYPTGLVNRTTYHNKTKLDYSELNGAVIQQIAQESQLGIKITNHWNENNRNIEVILDIPIFKEITDELKLQVWLVEDSIIAPQVNGFAIENNYIHKHVFRDALNGTWGEDLTGVSKNAVLCRTVRYELPISYVSNNCSIVAFIYLTKDKSVIQVNELKVEN